MLKSPSQNSRRGLISARQAMVATLIAVAVLLASPSVQLARAKGKPGGGGGGGSDPPSLPNARYQLTWLDGDGWTFHPFDINNLGELAGAGGGSAVAYSPISSGADLVDLNTLGALWLDLDSADQESADVTGAWFASQASSVNDAGEFTGLAEDASGVIRFFVLKDAFGAEPSFLLMPLDNWGSRPEINNDGIVVALTESGSIATFTPTVSNNWPYYTLAISQMPGGNDVNLNDDGIVVRRESGGDWTSYVRFPNEDTTALDGYRIYGLSNNWLCGHRLGTKGKNGQPGGWVRIPIMNGQLGPDDLMLSTNSRCYAYEINDAGDSVCELEPRGLLYHGAINTDTSQPYGEIPLDLMIESPDSDWLNGTNSIEGINNPNPITDPDGTGLGQICGWQYGTGGRGFILTPIVVGP